MRISDWSSDVCSSDLTYAAQRDLIKRRLVASGLDTLIRDACKVDTVDSYQGKENQIVILSLVRNNADGALEHGTATIRSEERSYGKECVSTCRSGWSPYH